MNKTWKLLVVFTVVIAASIWLASPTPLVRDTPRDLPWTLPDYRDAKVEWRIDELGRIENHVEHFFLEGISSDMVAWFYQQLPISTVNLNGQNYPLYHLFHPTEHGRIRVVEAAPDGTAGMAAGAIIMREEWFGEFDSKGAARLEEFSSNGMLAKPSIAGIISLGQVQHIYTNTAAGTHYRVEATIGSDLPIIGRLINYYIRTQVFHPEFMTQWQRHQIQEVSSLQFFLPQLYAQKDQAKDNHFVLRIEKAP